MNRLEEFAKSRWDEPLTAAAQHAAIKALETGKVLFFPQLAFTLNSSEQKFLSAKNRHPEDSEGSHNGKRPLATLGMTNRAWDGSQGKDSWENWNLQAKNISFDPNTGTLKNIHCSETDQTILKQLLQGYAKHAQHLLAELLPQYTASLQLGRTSFRPAEIEGRKTSYRKDDTRLHVDAFPASPNQGQRILRVFTNVNPSQPRIWRLGEPFAQVVQTFSPRLKEPLYGSAKVLQWLKLTRGYRTLYDHYMLQLHNAMKADLAYQKSANQQEMRFPPGSSWVVYTDVTSHAAMKGQFALEQTFYLPVHAMQDERHSPLRILEQALSQKLVPGSTLSYAS